MQAYNIVTFYIVLSIIVWTTFRIALTGYVAGTLAFGSWLVKSDITILMMSRHVTQSRHGIKIKRMTTKYSSPAIKVK